MKKEKDRKMEMRGNERDDREREKKAEEGEKSERRISNKRQIQKLESIESNEVYQQ